MGKFRQRRFERKGEGDEPMYARGGLGKLAGGRHTHIAEIYGETVTAGLRPWARDRVLAQVGR